MSRHSWRHLVAALLAGVLIGGGLMATTPAGAEVAHAAATNWKKIWKKKIQPHADKRYYKKAAADARYTTKAAADATYTTKTEAAAAAAAAKAAAKTEAAAAAAAAQAAANSATDGKLGNYYTKSQSEARYATTTLLHGTTMQTVTAAGAGATAGDDISFGSTLSAAPTSHYIPLGAPNPIGCLGSAAAPNAIPGHLCVWEVYAANKASNSVATPAGAPGASTMGAVLFGKSAAAGEMTITTVWAVRPIAVNAGNGPAPKMAEGNAFDN